MTATKLSNMALINKTFEKIEKLMGNLLDRWQDEKEYEDIDDYGKVIAKELPKEMEFLNMHKRPFGFTFELDYKIYKIEIKGNLYQWERLS